MSLKAFHLAFITLCIAGADIIGAWAINDYFLNSNLASLAMGLALLAGGIGLIAYGVHVFKLLERLPRH
ncbi:MAG: hypothetical protein U0166_09570 [Acidobacteriota bacterium]